MLLEFVKVKKLVKNKLKTALIPYLLYVCRDFLKIGLLIYN